MPYVSSNHRNPYVTTPLTPEESSSTETRHLVIPELKRQNAIV